MPDDLDLDRLEALLARAEALAGANKVPRRPVGAAHWTQMYPELAKRGEEHAKAKLNEDQVLEIRRQYVNGRSYRTLAREFGVSGTTICAIVKRRSWKHVPHEPDIPLDPLILHLRRQREAALAKLRAIQEG